jgi:signal transduction histidine kinase
VTRTRSAALRTSLESAEQQLAAAVETARSLTADLSPPMLFTSGLAAALQWLGARMLELHGLNVVVVADAGAEPQGEGSRILIFQSVRELLFNVVKHAGVDEALVVLSRIDGARIQLRVEDAGKGFVQAHVPAPSGSFGLFSIRERLTHMGGTMRIKSAPGQGTRVTLVASG